MFLQLGTTATGSRALGETFTDFFALSQEAIARQYVDTTNEHVIEDLIDLNFSIDESAPLLKFSPDEDKSLAIADLATLVDKGLINVDEELEDFIRAEHDLPEKTQDVDEDVDNTVVPPDSSQGATTTTLPVAASAKTPRIVHAAAGHREPSDIEKQAGVDFDAMSAAFDDALEVLVVEWVDQVKTAQVNELANTIAAIASDDVAALAVISATPVGQELLIAAMKDMASKAAAQATAELVSQGAEMDTPDLDDLATRLEARAGALTVVMARSLSEAAARAALAGAGGSLTSFDIATRVADHLNGLFDAYLRDQLGGAVMQAQNSARREVFEVGPPSTIYASELQDAVTCSACSDVDNKQYDSLAAAEADYPSGAYFRCAGGPRCRGTLIAVLGSEAEPSVQ